MKVEAVENHRTSTLDIRLSNANIQVQVVEGSNTITLSMGVSQHGYATITVDHNDLAKIGRALWDFAAQAA